MTYLPLPSPKGGGAIYFLDSLCRHIFFDCIDKREEKFMYICRAIYFLDDRYTARSFAQGGIDGYPTSLVQFFSAFMEGKVKIDHITS